MIHLVTVIGAQLALLACASGPASNPAIRENESAAEVLGHTITVAEVDEEIKERLLEERVRGNATVLYELRVKALERLIDARLKEAEAARRGSAPEELARMEVRESADEVTDREIEAFWKEHQATMAGLSLEELRPQIRRFLVRVRKNGAIRSEPRERPDVVVHLEAPRVEVKPDGPALGPADAPVTIIEFADFQCLYCKRSAATMRQVLARYPTDVRFVFRHLPIEKLHHRARSAAEASACAEEQGAFWPYHDKLFANNAALERDDLLRYARELDLDTRSFSECVDERRYQAKIDADLAAAQSFGMNGTPTFVVNGILLAGSKPADDFYRLVDSELKRKPSK